MSIKKLSVKKIKKLKGGTWAQEHCTFTVNGGGVLIEKGRNC